MFEKAIIICSRTDSKRITNKPFQKINGKEIIIHLIQRLQKTGLPIVIAYPADQIIYQKLQGMDNLILYPSKHAKDPLARMNEVINELYIENVIRINHDKIFVDPYDIENACLCFQEGNYDYLYSSSFTEGTGFEIMSCDIVSRAAKKYVNVEHISYAIKAITNNSVKYMSNHQPNSFRLLIDYPEDLIFIETILSRLGNDCSLNDVFNYLNDNLALSRINKLPLVTVYTCAYNAKKWIRKCLESVYIQDCFDRIEYVLIDDFSKDGTFEIMSKFAMRFKNVKLIRNQKNLGLASSSNVALENSKGSYIIRIDADDFFVKNNAISSMVYKIQETCADVIYPHNYYGDFNKIQMANENHHIGGALFKKSALNHIKFTDGLKGHDSLDIYIRAKDQLKIDYLDLPCFFYTQRSNSMSKINKKKREKIKEVILRNNHAKI